MFATRGNELIKDSFFPQELFELSIVANEIVFFVESPIEFERVGVGALSCETIIPSETE
jgi:hypothetical protein